MMPKPRRDPLSYLPNQFGYKTPPATDGVKVWLGPKLRHPDHILWRHHKVNSRNRIHLKEAAMNTTVPASTTSVVPKAQVKSVYQHTQNVQSEPNTPSQESPSNNKGNSNVAAQYVPNTPSAKVVEKAETKESRMSSRPLKPNRHCIDNASTDSIDSNSYSSNLLSKFIWYIKPPRTLQHPVMFKV